MIKLIYHQTRARAAPTWSHQPDADIAGLLRAENMADPALQPAVESVWNWLRSGSSASGGEGERLDAETAEALGAVLMQKQKDGDELIRVNACYRLQHATCAGLPQASDALLAVMDRGSEAGKRVAVQALGAAGEAVVPPLIQRVRDLAVHSDANLGENDEETIGRYFEAVCNSTTALGEAASDAKPSGWAGTAAAVDALLLCAAAVRTKSRNLDLAGPINPFCPRTGATGALASCVVAMDHIGQRCVELEEQQGHDVQPSPMAVCLKLLDDLLPAVASGADDLLRGEQDSGRAHSRRECVLAAEAIRNLCLLGPTLSEQRPELARTLLAVSESLTTSARLRGVTMEALSHLTRRARIGPTGDADRTEQVRERILHKLIEARWVTDGSGMGLEPNPQSTNTAAKDLPSRR